MKTITFGTIEIALLPCLIGDGYCASIRQGDDIGFGIKTEYRGGWSRGKTVQSVEMWNDYIFHVCTELFELSNHYFNEAYAAMKRGDDQVFEMFKERTHTLRAMHSELRSFMVLPLGIEEVV